MMKLSTKINLIVTITVVSFITVIFFFLAKRYEKLINDDLLKTARSFYKNIIITRAWIAKHDGVYIEKTLGVKSNPYLVNPDIKTVDNRILTLKNPAIVTRELSELSKQMGGNFQFHITSLNLVNPNNSPNNFERQALESFQKGKTDTNYLEFYRIEQINNKRYFRYFGPLYTEPSCINCHGTHGYKVGDVRGGISVILPMDSIENAKNRNYIFMLFAGFLTIGVLILVIYFLILRVVIKPVQKIETAAKALEDGNYTPLQIKNNDEIGDLAKTFQTMRQKIQTYTQDLQQSETKYRTLINCSAEAVLIINDKNKIIDANKSITQLSQYEVAEVLNKPAQILFTTPLHNIKAKNRFETVLKLKDGSTKPVEIYIISENFAINGETNLRLFYLHDLSDRKRMERIMIDTEKMFALNQLSSGIAHEIRNPLFSIRNNLNYLQEKLVRNSEFTNVYSEIDTGVKRINTLVNSILDYTRPHQSEFKKTDLRKVVNRSLELVGKQFEKAKHTVTVDIPLDFPKIEIDPHKIEQVFINLSTNSLHAMGENGKFKIAAQLLKKSVKIIVSDNGYGIDKNDLSRIFDPFFTRTANGSGLGLSIVKNIIQQHNGEIRVKSEIDQGTSFIITLPLTQH